jgi:hypothetical protein
MPPPILQHQIRSHVLDQVSTLRNPFVRMSRQLDGIGVP